jgi:corrinoid protein of di/trimethylamine methyltransferase
MPIGGRETGRNRGELKEVLTVNEEELLDVIYESMIAFDQDKLLDLVKQALSREIDAHRITHSLSKALEVIGDKYAQGECFIPELIFSGEIFHSAMEILEPEVQGKGKQEKLGKIVLGTVQGDLHDLGLKLVSLTLSINGFDVFNLGRDVPVETFLATVKSLKPQILGLSALLTTTLNQQREAIEALKHHHLRDQVKVMIGGAPVTQEWAEAIGADAVGFDAIDALKKAKQLIGVVQE